MEQEQTNQIEHVEQTEPAKLNEPVEPVEPVEPIEPVEPVEPIEPVEPVEPVKPTEPVEPVELMEEIKLESVEPVNPVESKIPEKYLQVIQLIQLMLSSNDKFNEMVTKAHITLTVKQSREIKNILDYLIKESDDSKPIVNIIGSIQEALSNNKLELHEIPKLINVIHDSMLNLQSIVIDSKDVGLLIKLVLFILIETNQVELSTQDSDTVFSLIDMSIVLLNKSVEIKLPKTSKCFCF